MKWIAACLLVQVLAVLSSGIAPAGEKPTVLFAVSTRDKETWLAQPFASLNGGKVEALPVSMEPPSNDADELLRWVEAKEKFAKHAFPPGARLTVLDGGRPSGTLRVTTRNLAEWEAGCDYSAIRTAREIGTVPTNRSTVLATNVRGGATSTAYRRRSSLRNEELALRLAVEAVFAKKGIPNVFIRQAEVFGTRSFAAANGSLIVSGHFTVFIPQGDPRYGMYTLFLLLEGQDGKFTVAHVEYDPATRKEPGYFREEAIDVIDIDRDGRPEIVTYLTAHEASDFAVYRKRGRHWRRIFIGGGGSC